MEQNPIMKSLEILEKALGELDKATQFLVENQKNQKDEENGTDAQIQRLAEDRANLARELDNANARAENLKQVNEQVSRKLVDVMEKIKYINENIQK